MTEKDIKLCPGQSLRRELILANLLRIFTAVGVSQSNLFCIILCKQRKIPLNC